MQPIDTAYHDLANAIVMQAVTDYRNALKGISYDRRPAEFIVTKLEKFFRSTYYRTLTRVNGEYLIEQLRKEHRENEERSKNESNTSTGNA